MARRSTLSREVAGFIALFMLCLSLYTPPVQAQTNSDEFLRCVSGAWEAAAECVIEMPWWADLICFGRYALDLFACIPMLIAEQ